MADNSQSNISSSATSTSGHKAKARLEYLLDASYAKIEELRLLLKKQSDLQWKDCMWEIDPVIARQRCLHETVMKRISDLSMQLPFGSSASSSSLKANSRVAYAQPKNVKNQTPSQIQQPLVQFHQSSPFMGSVVSIPNKEVSQFDTVRTAPTRDVLQREETTRQLADFSQNNKDGFLQIKEEKHWYGSLDRNVVKKKKRGSIDKARRHTKIIGSTAALELERTDELQPDEQYKIGLPMLTRSDTQGHSQLNARTSRLPSPQPPYVGVNPCLIPPPPPPKTPISGLRTSTTLPALFFKWQEPASEAHGLPGDNPVPKFVTVDRLENKEVKQSKAWFETNLDDTTIVATNSAADISVQSASSGFSSGLLDGSDSLSRLHIASPATDISEKSSKSSESSEARGYINETIKPFEMADYYKYSTKYRKSQNANQTGDTSKLELISGSSKISSTANDNESVDTNRNPGLPVPKLPPRDSTVNANLKPKPICYRGLVQNPEAESFGDTDSGWVMDTPTFV